MPKLQGLVEDHAERQERQGGGDDRVAPQPDETTAAPAQDGAAADGPAGAARGAAKAEQRRQAQGKQSRRDALQTRVKVPVALRPTSPIQNNSSSMCSGFEGVYPLEHMCWLVLSICQLLQCTPKAAFIHKAAEQHDVEGRPVCTLWRCRQQARHRQPAQPMLSGSRTQPPRSLCH